MTFFRRNSYLVFFFSLIVVFTFYTVVSHNAEKQQLGELQIEKGDTLWELAESFSGETPHHEWIEEIMEVNNLKTTKIVAGQSLKIPADQLNFSPDETKYYAGDAE